MKKPTDTRSQVMSLNDELAQSIGTKLSQTSDREYFTEVKTQQQLRTDRMRKFSRLNIDLDEDCPVHQGADEKTSFADQAAHKETLHNSMAFVLEVSPA